MSFPIFVVVVMRSTGKHIYQYDGSTAQPMLIYLAREKGNGNDEATSTQDQV